MCELETSAVCQDRPVPRLEPVESAGLPKSVQTGTEIKMISIPENDFCVYVVPQVLVVHSLDGAHGAHRHEYGGLHLTVIGSEHPGSCARAAVFGLESEFHVV